MHIHILLVEKDGVSVSGKSSETAVPRRSNVAAMQTLCVKCIRREEPIERLLLLARKGQETGANRGTNSAWPSSHRWSAHSRTVPWFSTPARQWRIWRFALVWFSFSAVLRAGLPERRLRRRCGDSERDRQNCLSDPENRNI